MEMLNNIRAISKFESRTLFRSWFFRIFAIIGVLILTLFNLAMLLGDGPRWNMRAVSSVIPYVNLILFNVALSIIASFLASEFLKRDRKLDTTEVIYIRSMSNGEYVIGKTIGILKVFFALTVLFLTVSGIINLFLEEVSFDVFSYLVYPVLITFPTLVFILGLAYLLMMVVKNQAVTFVLLLGYIASCLFYLSHHFNHVFDFMAFSFPMVYSDMAGFADITGILLQRGSYLFMGLGFILFSVVFINRLEQSRPMWLVSLLLSLVFMGGGGLMMAWQIISAKNNLADRQEMMALESRYIGAPNVTVKRCDLEVAHRGDRLAAVAGMRVANEGGEPLTRAIFSLNPGLTVSSVTGEGGPLPFTRERHLVLVDLALAAGQSGDITLVYEGTIDENACYLDIDEEDRNLNFRIMIYPLNKKYSFLKPGYVLLTREAKWYPSSRLIYSKEKGMLNPAQFVDYTLKVTTTPGLTAISQGRRDEGEKGVFHFTNEKPLTDISLIIGRYREWAVTVDSVEYFLAVQEGHDYFRKFFTHVEDTVPYIIREVKEEYESKLELDYPFKRFGIVEVPVHFVSFPRVWTLAKEVMQPEMSLFPEKGMGMAVADFQFRQDRAEQQNKESGGEETEAERETAMLKDFLSSTLTSEARMFFGGNDGLRYFSSSFVAFPSYYTHAYYLHAKDWTFLNRAFESYWMKKTGETDRGYWAEALTDDDKANVLLQEKSFQKIVKEEEAGKISNVISAKGNYLFTMMESTTDPVAYRKTLAALLKRHSFSVLPFDTFAVSMEEAGNAGWKGMLTRVSGETPMAAFLVDNIRAVSFKKEERTWYGVSFKMTNTEPVRGLVKVGFRMGGGRGGGDFFFGRGQQENLSGERLVSIDGGKTLEIQVILDDEPRALVVNTLISKNLPSRLTFTLGKAEEINGIFEESIKMVDKPVVLARKNEFIVDNEGEGFTVTETANQTPLRALIAGETEEEEKYIPMRWRGPHQWKATISTGFYGSTVRSAHFIRSGDGIERATWVPALEEAGYYDIYTYIGKGEDTPMRGDDGDTEYHYIVHGDDGEEEVELMLKDAKNGWNHLGSFYVTPNNARVELTDRSKGRSVVADAVKWEKRD